MLKEENMIDFLYVYASFCFQITLPNNEMSFDAIEITNIELHLPYSDFYGDPNTSFMISIKKLKYPVQTKEHLFHSSL